jgi:catechol 2,3-dioxygenase-like lactoylglutathione lyase family enzyme
MALTLGPVHHIALLVEDLAGAEAFYCGVLGLRVDRRWPDDKNGTRSVWLSLGNDAILMLERGKRGAARRDDAAGGGWHLLALRIDAADRARIESELARKNVTITGRTDYTLYLRDPEGNRIGLSHYPHPVPVRP